jgi:HAE1 family hydrophobic/amphiphilic exporter-1
MSITEVSIKRPAADHGDLRHPDPLRLRGLQAAQLQPAAEVRGQRGLRATTYRGASPEEIQNTITKPLEDAVSAIEGVDQISPSRRKVFPPSP